MLSNISGFIISAMVHIFLVAFVLNVTESPKPRPHKIKPVVLTLAMFKPETSLAPKLEKIMKKPLLEQKPESAKKINVTKVNLKPVVEKYIKSSPLKRQKSVKQQSRKKRLLRKTRVKTKVKPKTKTIKQLKPKPKRNKKKLGNVRKTQLRVPIKRITRAVVHRPVRKVEHTTKHRKIYPPVRHIVSRSVAHKNISHRNAQNRTPHSSRKSVAKRYVVKSSVKAVIRKRRAVSPKSETTVTTKVSRQAIKRYKARLRQLIEANKRYPKRAKRRGEQGTTIVSFIIVANGQVKSIRISKSSGSAILDSATKKAVSNISGKLPFTSGIKKQQWQFTIPVVYRLR